MSGVDPRRILTFPAFCGSVDPMKKVRSITTGAGDAGKTKLFSGEEVSKNSLRTDAYGTIDELESILGVARVHADRDDVREGLLYVQRTLFIVAAELATTNKGLKQLPRLVGKRTVREMEGRRLVLEQKVKMPRGFVIPGATLSAAHIDHARSVARRCERKVVGLYEQGYLSNALLLVWMNRLSDYLWLLARLEEQKAAGSPQF